MREKSQRLKDAEELVALRKLLARSQESEKQFRDKWVAAEGEKGAGLADKLERGKLEKQLRIVGHIAAGRKEKAITEILTPLPVAFSMQFVVADDKTRTAEDDTLERFKGVIAQSGVIEESLKTIKVKREGKVSGQA